MYFSHNDFRKLLYFIYHERSYSSKGELKLFIADSASVFTAFIRIWYAPAPPKHKETAIQNNTKELTHMFVNFPTEKKHNKNTSSKITAHFYSP